MTENRLLYDEARPMRRVVFFVPGKPVAKGRARSVPLMRNGKPVTNGKGRPVVIHHTPETTVNYEALVKLSGREAMAGASLIDGPVELILDIKLSIPKSWSKKKQAAAVAGRVVPTVKPDGDNVLKALKDGMNGIVWNDDVQVVNYMISKRYSLTPGVRVQVEQLPLEAA